MILQYLIIAVAVIASAAYVWRHYFRGSTRQTKNRAGGRGRNCQTGCDGCGPQH